MDNGRLRWRCRRGMRELDVLLARYLETRYPQAPEHERDAFRRLLDLPDPELQGLLLGRAGTADEGLAGVLEQIRRSP